MQSNQLPQDFPSSVAFVANEPTEINAIRYESNDAQQQDNKRRRTQTPSHTNFASTSSGTRSAPSYTPQSLSCIKSNAARIKQNKINAARIRHNYLRTIGIERQRDELISAQQQNRATSPTRPPVATVEEPLKREEEDVAMPFYTEECEQGIFDDDITSSSQNWGSSNISSQNFIGFGTSPSSVMTFHDPTPSHKVPPPPPRKKVSFNTSVAVRPIPTRSEYSDRMKSQLWSTRQEIHMNATRNAIEFTAENWDWRQAAEDDDMIICAETGELVHPVHYARAAQYYHGSNCQKENLLLLSRMAALRWEQR